jgi:hypothetical protein
MMTRKDYVKFAAMLKDQRQAAIDCNSLKPGADTMLKIGTLNTTVFSMADIFAADNPNFDRDRFLQACGVNK